MDRLAPAAGAALPMAVLAALDTAAADEGTRSAGEQTAAARCTGGVLVVGWGWCGFHAWYGIVELTCLIRVVGGSFISDIRIDFV